MLTNRISVESLLQKQQESPQRKCMNALVVGEKGTGKTTLLGTAPTPILLFSFDPGGYSVLQNQINANKVLVIDLGYEDDYRNPRAYSEFERTFNALCGSGEIDKFATVALDSTTTFMDALLWQIMKKEGRILADMNTKNVEKDNGMRIQDWNTVNTVMTKWTRSFYNTPCHSFFFGHVGKTLDEVTGAMVNQIVLPGQSKDKFPANIPELFVTTKHPMTKEYEVFTAEQRGYVASTRLPLDPVEKPNLRDMMKKSGLLNEDKPDLV